jgi:antitoxin YefM
MAAISISQARETLFPLVRQVNDDHTVIEIVARNGGNAVLMSAEDYESLQETLHLFSTRANATHILRGLAEAGDGRAEPVDLDELERRFGPAEQPTSSRKRKPTAKSPKSAAAKPKSAA